MTFRLNAGEERLSAVHFAEILSSFQFQYWEFFFSDTGQLSKLRIFLLSNPTPSVTEVFHNCLQRAVNESTSTLSKIQLLLSTYLDTLADPSFPKATQVPQATVQNHATTSTMVLYAKQINPTSGDSIRRTSQ